MNFGDEDPVASAMKNAKDDLAGSVSGRFSPSDWDKILGEAESRLKARMLSLPEAEAWAEVMREFRRESYWGYVPNYRPPSAEGRRAIGITLVWFTFQTMTVTKVAVLWASQRFEQADSVFDKWLFFALLLLIPGNAAFFVWRHRRYPIEDSDRAN